MTNIYFFYNIYGDAQDLLNTIPENVTPVQFGWTEEIESYRNNLLSELNVSIPSLPCIVAWDSKTSVTTKFLNESGNVEELTTPVSPKWSLILINNWPKEDWTWEKINKELEKF